MAKNTFNWCFIGTGSMAKIAARQMALTRSRSHRIVSVFSKLKEDSDKFVLWFGGKAYDSLDDAILADGVDAVYIATSHDSHYELAKRCIELGKPVLVEKPFTINSKQAEELFNLAEEKNLFIDEAMWTWFSPIARKVREWVVTGEIGDVKHVEIKYAMASSKFYRAPRKLDKNLGGGALLDIGVYPLSYCYNIFGKPCEIICKGDLNEDGIDNGEKITLKYENDLTCNLSISLTTFEGPENAVITGTSGVITIPLFHQAVKATLISDTKRETTRSLTTYMTEFDVVAEEIRAGKLTSELVPKENVLGVMRIMDECRAQMGVVYPCE